jgi:hypothetical protein
MQKKTSEEIPDRIDDSCFSSPFTAIEKTDRIRVDPRAIIQLILQTLVLEAVGLRVPLRLLLPPVLSLRGHRLKQGMGQSEQAIMRDQFEIECKLFSCSRVDYIEEKCK